MAEDESFGLFDLTSNGDDKDYVIDIVAIHGLGGHYRRSWTYEDDNVKALWLQDFLPAQLRDSNVNARVMSYGYDSSPVFTKSVTSIDNEAERLLDRLDIERDLDEEKNRPIILIAHSLGGLIAKKALILAQERTDHYGDLLKSIRGVVFLGVPHRGADIAYWASLPAHLVKISTFGSIGSTDYLGSLQNNSEIWRNISKQFVERGISLKIRTFFETDKMGNVMIVDEDSARLNLPNERAVGLAGSNHRTICKFQNKDSQRYKPVWMAIRRMATELLKDKESSYDLSEKELNCLRALYTSNYEQHKARNPDRSLGTCEWIFSHSKYLEWIKKETASLLWISADPGCGKTVLATFLVDYFRSPDLQRQISGSQDASRRDVCYFFFRDDNDQQNNASLALSAILYQYFMINKHLVKHLLVPEYDTKGATYARELNTLWRVLIESTTVAKSYDTICIIDGLDECDESTRNVLMQMLAKFHTNSTKSRLKILVTGRPYLSIEDRLNHPLTIRLRIEDQSDLTTKDLELVIRARIRTFAAKRRISPTAREKLVTKIVNNAGQTFLWASLVLDDLELSPWSSEQKLKELVDQIPETLDDAYEKILNRAKNSKDTRRILNIILGAARPLTLTEMNIAFVIKADDQDHNNLDLESDITLIVRSLCGLFVKIADRKIYLIHQTARDFLIQSPDIRIVHKYQWKGTLSLTESHMVLAEICITYLMFSTFQNRASPADFTREDDFFNYAAQFEREYDFFDYAAQHWALHFQRAQRKLQTWFRSAIKLCTIKNDDFGNWFEYYMKQTNDLHGNDVPQMTPMTMASYFGHEVIVQLLLDEGSDVNQIDAAGETALHWAVINGNETTVSLLIENGANMETENYNGYTALANAIVQKNDPMVSLLVGKGANTNSRYHEGETALDLAITGKNEAGVRFLIMKGLDINSKDDSERTPLHRAASHGFEVGAKLLLDKGAIVNAKDAFGWTALLLAVDREDDACIKLLIKAGADVDAKNNDGWTAILCASCIKFEAGFTILLHAGANVNAHIKGMTPLHFSASREFDAGTRLLIDFGAQINAKNDEGKTPLHYASPRESLFGDGVRILLEAGAKIDAKDNDGVTPLHYAAFTEFGKSAETLLEAGAKIDAKNNRGETPLHWAASSEFERLVEIFLEAGAKIDAKDNKGETPLHWAAAFKFERTVKKLLDAGADPKAMNDEGRTALREVLSKNSEDRRRLSSASPWHCGFEPVDLSMYTDVLD